MAASPFANIDVGNFAKPEVYDVNGDGLPDLIVGRPQGNLHYFENMGTTGSPSFSSVATNANFGEVNVKPNLLYGESTPRVVKLAHNSQPYLLVGNVLGNIWLYRLDADKRYSGAFTKIDSVFSGIDVGEYAHFAVADIDGDGKFEMVVGSLRGGLQFFKETDTPIGINEVEKTIVTKAYPNPADGYWNLELGNLTAGQPLSITVYDLLGRKTYEQTLTPPNVSQTVAITMEVGTGMYLCRVQQASGSATLRLLAR